MQRSESHPDGQEDGARRQRDHHALGERTILRKLRIRRDQHGVVVVSRSSKRRAAQLTRGRRKWAGSSDEPIEIHEHVVHLG